MFHNFILLFFFFLLFFFLFLLNVFFHEDDWWPLLLYGRNRGIYEVETSLCTGIFRRKKNVLAEDILEECGKLYIINIIKY